jgi:DNA polymerase-3 subunit alpha
MAMGEAADHLKTDWRGRTVDRGRGEELRGYRNKRPMKYVSLHHHTTYSYKDGFALPEAHVRRCSELNMSAMAVTEHGNVSSWVALEKAAEKTGIKPIYGCEVYTGDVGEAATQKKNHLTLLARDQEGARNLMRLVTQGFRDFHFTPTVSGDNLRKHRSGLIALSGCSGSLLSTSLIGGKNVTPEEASYERGRDVARRFKRALGGNYFLEVQAFPELENVCQLNQMIERLGKELKIPLVATCDVHYTQPNESEMQIILHSIGRNKSMEELEQSWGYDVPLSPPINDNVIFKRLVATGLSARAAKEAILNTAAIAEECNVVMPKLPRLRYPTADALALFKEWLKDGWKFRGCDKLPGHVRDQYRAQLKKEMGVITEKDFIDYFLVVSDLIKFCKDVHYRPDEFKHYPEIPVGPARGSAAASIVCWLLRITEVNPMLFPNMLFERFIDVTRMDLPDIDLDFDSELRRVIWDYSVWKYGEGCVGNIGTFTYFKSKNSLDDVALAHHIPKHRVETVKGLLLERSSGDLRASATIEDTVEMFEEAAAVFDEYPELYKAMELEGNIKGMGVHAAGLVLANGPITDVCAIYEREVPKKSGNWYEVISLDKEDAERQGILKVDILGLSTMTALAECLRLCDMPLSALYNIPLDDPEVIDGFQRNDVVGVFQFDGRAMRSVNAELKPDNFLEVCDVNALARPGPLHNNASAEYVDIKWGRKQPKLMHPLLEPITQHTHYQIVYQEQILRIVREIGGFDWTAAAYIRKIISKKLGEQEFNRQWEKFRDGAIERGVEEAVAKEIWGHCITAGAYAFNIAHCVSYGMLAWWCMWFKVHHPLEFYTAWLRKMPPGDKGERHLDYLKDAHKHGIKAEPPDPVYSETTWTAAEGRLIGGLEQVDGIGDKMGPELVKFRHEMAEAGTPITCWNDYQKMKGIGPKKIENFEVFCANDDPYRVLWLRRHIDAVKEQIKTGELGPLPQPTHTSEEIPYTRSDSDTNVVWIGILRHRNLRDLFESNFARTGVALDPEEVKDPHLREWVIGIGADDDELVTITWDRWSYPKFKRAIWNIKLDHDLVLIRGVKKGFQARRAVYVKDMWILDPED